MGRIIFHIDMNSFFASCEIAENPDLFDKDVAVAPYASERKSIILAANYNAKRKGIKTTMHVNEALKICPNLIIVDSNHQLYNEYSRKFFSYFLTITPLVEPASIDEGFLDVTDVCKTVNPLELAEKIQKDLIEKFKLPCSIGIAPNKFLAKMASDMKKPLGITVLRKREIKELLWPLPISDMQGVGKKTLPILQSLKIHTIGDLATYSNIALLELSIGKQNAMHLIRQANGEGSTEIDVNRFNDVSSISNSTTLDFDEYDPQKLKSTIKWLTNTVCSRLEKKKLKAQTFTIQIKYNTFKTFSKSRTIDSAINDSNKVYTIVEDLFEDLLDSSYGVRLLGVGASKLKPYQESLVQMSIFDKFDEVEKDNAINSLIKTLNNDFGSDVLKRGFDKKELKKEINDYYE